MAVPRDGKLRFAGVHDADHLAVAPHGELGGELVIVRPLARGRAVECEIVAADGDRLPGLKLGNSLDAPLRLADDAEQRDA